MTSFVACHLMYGVMNRIQVRSLSALCKVELACGSAVLSSNSHLQILLGAVGNNLAQKLCKLSSMLRLLEGSSSPVLANLGIALSIGCLLYTS